MKSRNIELLTSLGKKVSTLALGLLSLSIVLIFINTFGIKNYCQKSQNDQDFQNDQNWTCIADPIIANLYSSFIASAVTIIGVEIVLRNETIKQIEEIYHTSEAVKHIKIFYKAKDDYSQKIISRIKELPQKQEVKLLTFFEEIRIFSSIDTEVLSKKIEQGCLFRILILHPDSKLLICVENSGNNFGGMRSQIIDRALKSIKTLANDINRNPQIMKGGIEVRFFRDMFSSFCYFSDPDIHLLWFYCLDSKRAKYPGLEISDKDIIKDIDNHFEHLWQQSGSNQIYKFENGNLYKDETSQFVT